MLQQREIAFFDKIVVMENRIETETGIAKAPSKTNRSEKGIEPLFKTTLPRGRKHMHYIKVGVYPAPKNARDNWIAKDEDGNEVPLKLQELAAFDIAHFGQPSYMTQEGLRLQETIIARKRKKQKAPGPV